MRFLVFGGGFGLSAHLPALNSHPGVSVVGIVNSGANLLSTPNGVRQFQSIDEALDYRFDAVSVALPPSLHHEVVTQAIGLGKHVLCEKPFGLNETQAREMSELAQSRASLTTAVNFQYRFEPGIRALRTQLLEGSIGDLQTVIFSWMFASRQRELELKSWKNEDKLGGGVLYSLLPHISDLIYWLTQSEPDLILRPEASKFMESSEIKSSNAWVDSGSLFTQVQLRNRVNVFMHLDHRQIGGEGMSIELLGTRGVLHYRHISPFRKQDQHLTLSLSDSRSSIELFWPESSLPDVGETRVLAMEALVRQFMLRIEGYESKDLPTFNDGVRAHSLISIVRESLGNIRGFPTSSQELLS